MDALTSRDLKLAIGEEVEEEPEEELEESEPEIEKESLDASSLDTEDIDEDVLTQETEVTKSTADENEGVESLKKLLAALLDHDVAASLKGMKISINITLGDK
jgi:uncharacterized membrane protein